MRFAAFAAITSVAALLAGTASATPRDNAGDNFFTAMLNTPQHERALMGGEARGQAGQAFMVANDGSTTAFVTGCDNNCSSLRVELRAAGLPTLAAVSTIDNPHAVVLAIPANYARSLSNFEMRISMSCAETGGCYYRWALLAGTNVPTLAQRGLPAEPSDAEWSASAPPSAALHWISRPSGDDLRFFYPVQAWSSNRSGSAQLQCLVANGGGLRCRAHDETPAGDGFGDAARRLSTILRVGATDAAGQSTANRQIVIPVQFSR